MTTAYIVQLSDDQFLSDFTDGSMWPRGVSELHHAKPFSQSETAKYAAEVCREKLNDDYDVKILQVNYSIDKIVI